ncbi:radical SAM family heme chaperone HemW [Cyanobium sp. Candia 9D4]|uniref:radical SAM family heme chaperone HemW n=1 Tax=Cyanobium sp. Candia 9D4 TaxID=2823707 RepID=UPI0020CDD05A|nr:radical SAM family heme chaperone HemW [Cyanobium sp. Candia 9D4]MCP9934967.1 radical SAM family heme chaperone HemW [Cyanobium sp. Candia 9D4]
MDPRSAYVHIPFCHRRCFYCDFPVVPLGDRADGASSGSIAAYLPLLHREIASSPAGPPLATVYLGGGTPSMLTGAQVAGILEALECRYGLAPGAELTLELDPASFDQDRLADYLAAGINRVSLGGQSFDDRVLAELGRRHRRADLREAAGWLRQARRRGHLASWSLDLIQGLPRQGLAHWDGQLAEAIALEPPHLSVYDLSIEPGTVFERRLALGQLELPPEDLAADLMDLTWSRLSAAGFGHYEVSNYALPGHASRHNRVYWSGAGWWGFGMGATGAPRGRRRAHPRTRAGYAEAVGAGEGGVAERGVETGGEEGEGMPFDERLMVGLRCREGVNLERLARQERLAPALLDGLRARLGDYERRGLLRVEGPRWRLADPQGLALSNGVLREMLAWWQELEQTSPRAQPAPAP